MSYSSDLKQTIMNEPYKASCCRKAFVQGILSSKASIVDSECRFNLEKDEHATFVLPLISEFYGKEATVSRPPRGGRCRQVSFSSKSAVRYLGSIGEGAAFFTPKCSTCAQAFYRGVFFASGRLSDPEKQYLLEFSPISYPDALISMLGEIDIPFRLVNRRSEWVITSSRSAVIEDFLALVGLTTAAFDVMNEMIRGEFLNNANRAANCVTRNIDKSVAASQRQLAALKALEAHGLLSSLPEELERTARLRLAHHDKSLYQLSMIAVPKISKSGLAHRLGKIMQIAETLLPDMKF
ncbi:MAG: DNA-binding protein WhiA [Clostridia bacterium]|nr:DNA-binding protein WhiA [Clostridia bacterium]